MKNKAKRLPALLLALSMLPVLAGCGESSTVTAAIPKEDSPVSEFSSAEEETVPVEYYANSPDKSENVSVKASADGTPEKVTVSVTLARRDDEPIQDFTTLTDIKNTEGSESFTRSEDGTLVWENKGRNISYEGQADADALPVGVHLAYELDGSPISAEELAGKSGRVKITITYDNRTEQLLGGYVPFMAMSVLVLGDKFYDIDVDHGSVMTVSDTTAVLGYAIPGLSQALGLTSYELFKDTELPESVEITAYTTDFEMELSATIFSNGLLSELEEDDLEDLDDVYTSACSAVSGANKLKDAGDTVKSAVKALVSGLGTVGDSITQLSQAVSGAASQAGAISVPGEASSVSRIDTIDSIPSISTEGLSEEAAAAVSEYVSRANAQISSANAAISGVNSQIDSANAAIGKYNSSRDSLAGQISSLQSTLNAISASLSGAGTDTSSTSQVNSGVKSYVSAVNKMCSSLSGSLWKYGGTSFYNLKENLKQIRLNDLAYTSFSGCTEGQECEVSFLFETARIKK